MLKNDFLLAATGKPQSPLLFIRATTEEIQKADEGSATGKHQQSSSRRD
jgi:hypothetical protein